ncbi:MAG: D-alanyl-D-alanine carboxypeptidase family protein [Verrucomicrobia bacterium]|nr:D-alanyl-D-alanine carboxypeptidase family protein [Verrucomicrobiota bacterium]
MDHSDSPRPGTPPTGDPVAAAYAASIRDRLTALGIPETYGVDRGLTLQPEADVLEVARVVADGRRIELQPEVAAAWRAMVAAAVVEGITLLLISGFRSVQRQQEILERKRAAGETIESILRVNAAPGYSEHHTGRAVDIGTPGCPPLEERFEETPAYGWLSRNAGRYGFSLSYPRGNPNGLVYEPWHWLHRVGDRG